MRGRALRLATVAGLAASALLIGGCGGSAATTSTVTSTARPASAPRLDGLVAVHTITYTSSSSGSHVTALVAIPRAVASRGCVILQYGFGSTKEDSAPAWQGLAALGLSTFSIDFHYPAASGSSSAASAQVAHDPTALAEVIRGTVADLRSAIDYLEKQPYCFGNVAYAGVSLGGIVGTILTATDQRVKAAVIMSTPGTFGAALGTPGTHILPGIARDSARGAAASRILSPLDPARFIGRIAPRPVLILSGAEDKTVSMANARVLQAAARRPKTIVDYSSGADPTSGPDASSNGQAIASFLLRHVVEPTYGISGNANGTFNQQ